MFRDWVVRDRVSQQVKDKLHRPMRVLLVPFNVEVEQLDGRILGERKATEYRRVRLGTLLDKTAQFRTSVRGEMFRLRGIVKEFLEYILSLPITTIN